MTRRRRGGLLLALAGAVGLLAALISLGAGSDAPPTRVVVARQPLAAGVLIDEATAAALTTVPVPASLGLGGLLADPGEAVGRRLAAAVAAGEPLTQAALGGTPGLGPAPLSVGQRAVAVPLSAAGGAASGLQPGVRVDVVASTGEGPAGRTALVVADAEVLAVAPAAPEDGLSMPGDAILRATSQQALRITAALNFAREVRLLVRPPQEIGSGTGPHEVAAP